MIDLHTWKTPNGHKITMALEETGLPYRLIPVDISKGAQFAPDFLAISPNNRIPAIVDHEPAGAGPALPIFESGAILLYLANKAGQLMPADPREREAATQWLFWQVGGLGPMVGQNLHFSRFAPEQVPYAIERYVAETVRLYGVLDRRLQLAEYLAGETFSVADIAIYPWIVPHEWAGQSLDAYPAVQRWFEQIKARSATERAYAKANDLG